MFCILWIQLLSDRRLFYIKLPKQIQLGLIHKAWIFSQRVGFLVDMYISVLTKLSLCFAKFISFLHLFLSNIKDFNFWVYDSITLHTSNKYQIGWEVFTRHINHHIRKIHKHTVFFSLLYQQLEYLCHKSTICWCRKSDTGC